jgi:hypothetical protein
MHDRLTNRTHAFMRGRYPAWMHEDDHHGDPERVIPVLDVVLRPLARDLIGVGFTVEDAFGPVQMAVATLLLQRDGIQVLFDTERGMTLVSLIRGGRRIGLTTALAAWADSPKADGRPHMPDFVPWALISTFTKELRVYGRIGLEQAVEYGVTVCDWLPDADLGAVDAVESETRAISAWVRHTTKDLSAVTPELLAARYRDAVDRSFGRSR